MLVLTRKKQETIHIGDDITITVLRIRGKTIRLGIDAPMGYTVVRGELTEDGTGVSFAHTKASKKASIQSQQVASTEVRSQQRGGDMHQMKNENPYLRNTIESGRSVHGRVTQNVASQQK